MCLRLTKLFAGPLLFSDTMKCFVQILRNICCIWPNYLQGLIFFLIRWNISLNSKIYLFASDQIICRASSSGVSSAVQKTKEDQDGVLSKPAVEARAGSLNDVMMIMMWWWWWYMSFGCFNDGDEACHYDVVTTGVWAEAIPGRTCIMMIFGHSHHHGLIMMLSSQAFKKNQYVVGHT